MAGLSSAVFTALTSQELLVTVLGAAVLYLAAKISGTTAKIFSFWREWRFSAYAGSIGLEKEDVIRSVKGYVRQYGMEVDPCAPMDLADSLRFERKDLFRLVDEFISTDSEYRHLFIFADCGMGKTSFLINYFYRKRIWLKIKGVDIVLVTLSNAASFRKVEQVEEGRRSNTIVMIDALDEDPLVLDGIGKRVGLLLNEVGGFKRVIITCRSQFFESDDNIPTGTGILRSGPTKAGSSKELVFRRLYIAPFDRRQIRKYINVQLPGMRSLGRRARAHKLVDRVPNLALRPMLLAHIADILEQDSIKNSMSLADIYQALASAWVEREKHWVKGKELFLFSRRLASNLYLHRHDRGGEFCGRDEVVALAKSWGVDIRVEFLTGRSLLNRMSDGRCKFAHRSILEYFVVDDFISAGHDRQIDLTGEMCRFLLDRLEIGQEQHLVSAKWGSFAKAVSAEMRVGFPTNFNIYFEDQAGIFAGAVYGLEISIPDVLPFPMLLGEHIQSMMDEVESPIGLTDVRINVESVDERFSKLHIGVWCDRKVILSSVLVSSEEWQKLTLVAWREKKIYSLVGRLSSVGYGADQLTWKAATRFNAPGNALGIEEASGCQVVSVNRGAHGRVEYKLLPAFSGSKGPLASFGILRGGSEYLVRGRRFISMPAQDRKEKEWGRVVAAQKPLVPAAERWPVR